MEFHPNLRKDVVDRISGLPMEKIVKMAPRSYSVLEPLCIATLNVTSETGGDVVAECWIVPVDVHLMDDFLGPVCMRLGNAGF